MGVWLFIFFTCKTKRSVVREHVGHVFHDGVFSTHVGYYIVISFFGGAGRKIRPGFKNQA